MLDENFCKCKSFCFFTLKFDNEKSTDIISLKITLDVHSGRENEKWLNIFLKRI